MMKTVRRDLGDFQTPPELVTEVLATLGPIGARWPRVLEPTCGRGHFLGGLLDHPSPPREIQAIEIQPAHCRAAGERTARYRDRDIGVTITCADFFGLDLARDLAWRQGGPLLVVGNPPWVTNAELGSLESTQVPPKSNVKGLSGLAARTGASNFDVAEAVWLKLARDLAAEAPTIALLCKTSVARSILQFAHRARLPIEAASIRRIDAARWFDAAVDACLFQVTLAKGEAVGGMDCRGGIPVYPGLKSGEPTGVMGFSRGWLIADREAHRRCEFADGVCPRTWRQGLKHDAAAVMELAVDAGPGRRLRDRSGDRVEVEAEFAYPLIKGADLKQTADQRPRRAVLVTQRWIGEDTTRLAHDAPRLWAYLRANAARFEGRKSSIYRGRPPFALFGIGPYSFASFKVAICGLHKAPAFRAVGPVEGRPVLLDDTCYFLPCSSAAEAAALAALCNDPIALELIRSASFPDAKRPITKALLQRVDLRAILDRTDRRGLLARAAAILAGELAIGADGGPSTLRDRIEEALSTLRQDPVLV
jgi:hypothetical protein